MMQRSLKLGVGLALGLVLAVSSTASARVLSMTGQWYMNRGPLVDIPANGGPVGCGGGAPNGCVGNLKPLFGGIPAPLNAVAATGSAPAKFTLQSNAFSAPGGIANRQTAPVAIIPTVIQLASQFSLMAPGGTGTMGTGVVPAGAATFQANAWSNDPKQAARLAANFAWCPPAGNCTAGGTYGTYGAQIQYTAGANAFGGTMNMMLRDTGVVSIVINTVTLPRSQQQVLHQLVGGTSNPIFGKQVAGGSYANARVITLFPGPIHFGWTVSTPCTSPPGYPPAPAGCGIMVGQGPQVGTLPGSQNFDWGMPWTTGTVVVKNLAGGPSDPASTLTAMGTDSRTALGAGKITLVAGATTERKPSGNHFAALEIMVMDFGPTAAPALSTPAIVAMVALMLLAGGYLARGSFASKGSRA